ncbi:DUF3068 domain-containing protein [Streptomyces sp. NPDC050610]|uniref:DUF3068 domain-containing protein n=1 Tax=Streptomyces sp. NPDC050610 TaxID=3157097 RepID=UPI003436122A
MRRPTPPVPLILLGAGVFLLVLAPMLTWYVEPHAKRTSVDVNATTVFTGEGRYYDAEATEVRSGQKITITRRVLGDVAASDRSGRAVWDVSTTIDTPRTLKLGDPRRSFQWTTERLVTDRRTNAPVHCCGESPSPFEGEAYLKFPFDVQKRGYRWWDNTLGSTIPLRFAGVERVRGYQGYRFTGSVRPTRTGSRQVPGAVVGQPRRSQVQAEEWYANDRIDLVVDRRTGRVLNASLSPHVTLRAPGGRRDAVTLLQGDGVAFTPGTQREQVDVARRENRKLRLIGETAPLGAAVVGVFAAAGGVLLLVRGATRAD